MGETFVVFGGSGFLGGALVERLCTEGRRVIVADLRPPPGSPAGGLLAPRRSRGCRRSLRAGAGAPGARRLRERCRPAVSLRRSEGGSAGVVRRGQRARGGPRRGARRPAACGRPRPALLGHGLRRARRHSGGRGGILFGPWASTDARRRRWRRRVTVLAGEAGLRLSILRPRLISGSGRLGVFVRLFELVRRGLPVPLIGSGENHYQMVGVDDCARAIVLACERGFPRGAFNLGSAARDHRSAAPADPGPARGLALRGGAGAGGSGRARSGRACAGGCRAALPRTGRTCRPGLRRGHRAGPRDARLVAGPQ